jgi:hypothetical protein
VRAHARSLAHCMPPPGPLNLACTPTTMRACPHRAPVPARTRIDATPCPPPLTFAALDTMRRVRAGGSAGLLFGSAHPVERRVGASVQAGDGGAAVDGCGGGEGCVGGPASRGGGRTRTCGAEESSRTTDVGDRGGAIGGGAAAGRGGAGAAADHRGSEGRTAGERGVRRSLCWRWAVIRLGRVSAWHALRGSAARPALLALTFARLARVQILHEPWSVHCCTPRRRC